MIKGTELENRAVTGIEDVEGGIRKMKGPRSDPSAELTTLRERIEQARGLTAPRGSCCGHCYGEGTAAALRVIDGE